MSTDELVMFGLFVEAFTFPDLPMTQAIDHVVSAVEAGKLNLSFVPPALSPNPLATAIRLQNTLHGLPHDTKQKVFYIVAPTITLLTVVTTAMRVYARTTITGRMKVADWCAVSATVLSIVVCICYTFPQYPRPRYNGAGGRHIWDVSFKQFQYYILILSINGIIGSLCLTTARLALLAFYHELSPNVRYRRLMVGVGAFLIMLSLLSIPLVVLECRPSDIWNGTKIFTAKCLDKKKLWWALGCLTVFIDIVLLLLPVLLVMRLKTMRLWEKIQIVGLFGAGAFVCVLTLLRVLELLEVMTKVDATYLTPNAFAWCLAELDSPIIVSNLPAIRSLFSHLYHGRDRRRPSTFVLETDGKRAWKVEYPNRGNTDSSTASDEEKVLGVFSSRETSGPPDSLSSGGNLPGPNNRGKNRKRKGTTTGFRFFTRVRKGVTDSSLFKGSLFRDSTFRSRDGDGAVEKAVPHSSNFGALEIQEDPREDITEAKDQI